MEDEEEPRASRVRPGASPGPKSAFSANVRDPRVLKDWAVRNPNPESAVLRHRYDLIQKAEPKLEAAGFYDPQHYRQGNPYCKCGTVNQHNQRHEDLLSSVDDGA